MGHATTETTEQHYGSISNDRAINDIEKAWESRSEPPKDAKEHIPGVRLNPLPLTKLEIIVF